MDNKKICSSCKVKRDIVMFQKEDKELKTCSKCRISAVAYGENNREKNREKKKKYREKNREKINEQKKQKRAEKIKNNPFTCSGCWKTLTPYDFTRVKMGRAPSYKCFFGYFMFCRPWYEEVFKSCYECRRKHKEYIKKIEKAEKNII